MKLTIATLLVILGSTQAMALTVDQISCSDGAGNSLYLERDSNDILRGVLHDNFNGANIECEQGGWGSRTYQAPIVCTGTWEIAFGAYGKVVHRQVFINMSMSEELGAARAEYRSNWEFRNGARGIPRALKCKTELGQ